MECVNPTEKDLRHGQIMRDATGDGAKKKIAKRKLTNLGYMQGYCELVTSDERVKRMKQDLKLAASVAAINVAEAKEKEEKKAGEQKEVQDKAPKAVEKLEKNGRDITKLTKMEISAIMSAAYRTYISPKKSGKGYGKDDFVKKLKEKMNGNIGGYTAYVDSLKMEGESVADAADSSTVAVSN